MTSRNEPPSHGTSERKAIIKRYGILILEILDRIALSVVSSKKTKCANIPMLTIITIRLIILRMSIDLLVLAVKLVELLI